MFMNFTTLANENCRKLLLLAKLAIGTNFFKIIRVLSLI